MKSFPTAPGRGDRRSVHLPHWLFAAIVSQTFPVISGVFGGGGIFAFYAFMMVLQLVWVLTIMPETKGIPLEEIQKKMGIE